MSTIEKAISKFRKGPAAPSSQTQKTARFPRNSGSAEEGRAKYRSEDADICLPWHELMRKGILVPEEGRSSVAEEMRTIKHPLLKNVSHSNGNDAQNLIMITSSVPGEGKSYTSVNMAISIAMEFDKTALLVDADVARPSIAGYLGFEPRKGLVDYLIEDNLDLSELLLKTDLPSLSVLPAGRQHHHSSELLASENMKRLLVELANRYHDRIVIFDSPPLLATSEAKVLANLVGQVVVVVEAEKTSELLLNEALSQIPNANIVGLILNKSRIKSSSSQYGYHYYHDE